VTDRLLGFRYAHRASRRSISLLLLHRCFFYAGDRDEPPHVHVERDTNRAKVWLAPVRLQDSGGFARNELARIILMVREHEAALLRSWNDYFAD
jgi:hypothetical protein